MALTVAQLRTVGIDTTSEKVLGIEFRMSALNGSAERAEHDLDSAVAAVFGSLILRHGEEKAWRFIARRADAATVLMVPEVYAEDRSPHYGLAASSLVMDFGGNRLRVEAGRVGEATSSITFARRGLGEGPIVWVPEESSVEGESLLVGQHALDPNARQAGHDQLLRASARIGSVALDVSDALVFPSSSPMQPQVHLATQSKLV